MVRISVCEVLDATPAIAGRGFQQDSGHSQLHQSHCWVCNTSHITSEITHQMALTVRSQSSPLPLPSQSSPPTSPVPVIAPYLFRPSHRPLPLYHCMNTSTAPILETLCLGYLRVLTHPYPLDLLCVHCRIHVRRGDKVAFNEGDKFELKEYMDHVERWFDSQQPDRKSVV